MLVFVFVVHASACDWLFGNSALPVSRQRIGSVWCLRSFGSSCPPSHPPAMFAVWHLNPLYGSRPPSRRSGLAAQTTNFAVEEPRPGGHTTRQRLLPQCPRPTACSAPRPRPSVLLLFTSSIISSVFTLTPPLWFLSPGPGALIRFRNSSGGLKCRQRQQADVARLSSFEDHPHQALAAEVTQ